MSKKGPFSETPILGDFGRFWCDLHGKTRVNMHMHTVSPGKTRILDDHGSVLGPILGSILGLVL